MLFFCILLLLLQYATSQTRITKSIKTSTTTTTTSTQQANSVSSNHTREESQVSLCVPERRAHTISIVWMYVSMRLRVERWEHWLWCLRLTTDGFASSFMLYYQCYFISLLLLLFFIILCFGASSFSVSSFGAELKRASVRCERSRARVWMWIQSRTHITWAWTMRDEWVALRWLKSGKPMNTSCGYTVCVLWLWLWLWLSWSILSIRCWFESSYCI